MNESPFRKEEREFSRELTTAERIRETVTSAVNDIFVGFLPSDDIKQLPPAYMYPLGVILFLNLVAIFLYVFITGYVNEINQTFLSPISGYEPDKYCETVQQVNTGTYLGTQQGSWEGTENFEYSLSAYMVSITSYSITYTEYQDIMNLVYELLVGIGQAAMNQDLGVNLIYWMSLTFVPPYANNAQRFMFTGTPLTVFNREKNVATMSNVNGTCNATSHTTFDANSGILLLQYDYAQFMASPKCSEILDPTLMGYDANADGNTFEIMFDVRTLASAVAVNIGVSDLNVMVKIASFDGQFTYNGTVFNSSSYYDPKYPGMDPLVCISGDGPSQCVLKVGGQVFAFPIFLHAGMSNDLPVPCDCAKLSAEDLDSSYDPCNMFNLISGFVFYNSVEPTSVYEMSRNFPSLSAVNSMTYNASFINSYWGQTSDQYELLNSPEYRQSAYDFCSTTSGGTCNMVTFSSFDNVPYTWGVSPYYYQLKQGACRNTFYTSYDDWQLLVEVPFTPLIQQYQECHNDPTTVFLNQAGVSVGNVSILTPLCVLFIMSMLFVYARVFKVSIPKSYSKNDKDRALNTLAISLLLARDNCLKTNDNRKQMESLLVKLVEELTEHSEQTSNQFQTEAVDESGVNWGYIAEKALNKTGKMLNPLHISTGGGSLSEKNLANNKRNNAGVELSDAGGLVGGRSISTASTRSRMCAVDTNIIVLNKASTAAAATTDSCLDIDSSGTVNAAAAAVAAAGDKSMGTISINTAIDLVESYTRQFNEIARNGSVGGSSSPAYWILVGKTSGLIKMRVSDFREQHSAELLQCFYAKLEELITIHASIALSCEPVAVYGKYANVVAYAINGEVLLLKEARSRSSDVINATIDSKV